MITVFTLLSCQQHKATTAFSLPLLPQQITTVLQDSTHKQHVPENDFHRSALSRRLPQLEDSWLCTNMLGKGNTDFLLQFHCPWPFILEYRSQCRIPTPTRWKGKPLQLPTLPAGKATTSNPILTAEKHTSGGKLKSLLLEGKQCKNIFSC